jgi:hypothetical protein
VIYLLVGAFHFLKHLLLFQFSFLMILGGYPSGIKGGKKKQMKLCPSLMLSKALGKALNHKLYQYWALCSAPPY